MHSWESCYPYPSKVILYYPKILLNKSGLTTLEDPFHISPIIFAQAITILPSVPSGFFYSLSMSDLNLMSM